MWVALIAFVLGSLVVAEIGRRAAAGTLPRNHLAGIRVRATLASDEAWDVGHRAAGPTLLGTGFAGVGLAISTAVIGVTVDEVSAAGSLIIGAVILVAGCFVAAGQARRAIEEADAGPPG